jgi:bifunctional hydroxylase/dehydrase
MNEARIDVPVVVVGAGPSGLALAGELRLGGVDVVVLERLSEPTGESRGLGFTARAMEMFDQRGLLPRFGAVEISPVGHFGGMKLDYSILEGAHFGARGIPQSRTEAVLADWATELGADLRRGCEVTGLRVEGDDAHGECAVVEFRGPDGPGTLRARFVVGCDGGHSLIRRLAGFEFPGTDATIEMFLADVSGCDLPARQLGEKTAGGMVMSAPLGDGVDRIIVCERGAPPQRRTEPPSWAEVAAAWQRLTGQDISGGTASWVSSFYDATRLATEYRRGPVLLVGDAAHVHLPAGGQGLSVSVQDAMNLGWKLAATVRGDGPADLLDSYHGERHPVGERLMNNTQAQGYLYLSGAEVDPLRAVFGELMSHPEVRRHLAGMVSGLDIRYDVGPGEHPLIGCRIPDQELIGAAGKTSTVELLHPGRGVLLDLSGDLDAEWLDEVTAGWRDRVDVVRATPHEASPTSPLRSGGALLVRPDGYVAAAVPPAAGSAGPQTLDRALRRWFGGPRSPA